MASIGFKNGWGVVICVQMEDAGIEVPADHPSVMEWFRDLVMEEARRDAEGATGQEADGSGAQGGPSMRDGPADTSNRQGPLFFAFLPLPTLSTRCRRS